MTVITLSDISKSFRSYRHPVHRFLELFTAKRFHRDRVALQPLSLSIPRSQVVGIVGSNGAGKSTLLKLISGTLRPSTGSLEIHGRICALLELGAGFHPELSGLENIYLMAAVSGFSRHATDTIVESIIAFSGLSEVIHEPVKTYSSGMTIRLAFSVATCVDPDILILDETLSVGDGHFAKKSFDRIMQFKEAGKTILFCSHSMYQIQAICDRVLWLNQGRLEMDGDPDEVIACYSEHLTQLSRPVDSEELDHFPLCTESEASHSGGLTRILQVKVMVDGHEDIRHTVISGKSTIHLEIAYHSSVDEPIPTLGVVIIDANGHPITSATTMMDDIPPTRNERGDSAITITYPHFPLMKGTYWINVFLLCERGIHIHDKARMVAELLVKQKTPAIGVVHLPHQWQVDPLPQDLST